MSKPKIFVSHITEEAEIANLFKDEMEKAFLGLVDIFVSSDAKSLKLGKNWLQEITDGLRECAAMLVFCSPYSVSRPWINFECGAGWSRNIEIVPICHSGLRPVDLPLPVSLLQGIQASDVNRVGGVFQLVADKLCSQQPTVDYKALVTKIAAFEENYTQNTQMISHLNSIRNASGELIEVLKNLGPNLTHAIQGFPESLVGKISVNLDALQSKQHLEWKFGVNGMVFVTAGSAGGGSVGVLTIQITSRLSEQLRLL